MTEIEELRAKVAELEARIESGLKRVSLGASSNLLAGSRWECEGQGYGRCRPETYWSRKLLGRYRLGAYTTISGFGWRVSDQEVPLDIGGHAMSLREAQEKAERAFLEWRTSGRRLGEANGAAW